MDLGMVASLFANPEFATIFQKNPEYAAIFQRLAQIHPGNPGMQLQFALATLNQIQQRNHIFHNNNNQHLMSNANKSSEIIPPMTASTSSEVVVIKDSTPTPAPTPTNNNNNNNGVVDAEEKPKRRTRPGGGSSVKTAEVWRFFTQCPPPEQAATCSICNKIIKATNSSTTGMIRHLKSCHNTEYLQLMKARHNNLINKTLKDAPTDEIRKTVLQKLGESAHLFEDKKVLTMNENLQLAQSKHNIDNILNTANSSSSSNNTDEDLNVNLPEGSQEKLYFDKVVEAIKKAQHISAYSAFSPKITSTVKKETKRNSTSPLSPEQDENNPDTIEVKRIKNEPKLEDACSIVGQQIPQQNRDEFTTPKLKKSRKIKPPIAFEQEHDLWGENNQQSKEINEKIGHFLIADNQSASIVDQKGFRSLIQSIFPQYKMPNSEFFTQKVLPDVILKLQNSFFEIQQNNPYGLSGLIAPSPITTNSESSFRSGISPSSTIESGFHEDSEIHLSSTSSNLVLDLSSSNSIQQQQQQQKQHSDHSKADLEALVQRSVSQAQNISQSFGFSLDLSGEENSKEMDDSETASSKSSNSEFGRNC